MKKLFIIFSIMFLSFFGICFAGSKKKSKKKVTVTPSALSSTQTWTPVSQNQAEYNYLMDQCNKIAEYFTSMGATKSSAFSGAIFNYLKNIGTPTSLQVLKEQVAAGRIPSSYLNNI